MNRLGAVAVAGIVAISAAGCGDPPICQSDVFIAIQTSEVSSDADAITRGVQSDIRVRTSVEEGETATLEVFTPAGDAAGTFTATVDAAGIALFENVSLPDGAARLRASVNVFCGDATDELTIPVATATACTLTFAPAPEANPFFAPAVVYNATTDPDPVTAGYQATIIVNTAPNAVVEIFENTNNTDQSLGTFPSGNAGFIEIDRTLLDGTFSYRAFCTRETSSAVSAGTTIVVDTTPPTCAFAVPSPGTTITPSFDTNLDLSDGIQLTVTAQVTGSDTLGEPTTLEINEVGSPPTTVTTTVIDADGRASGATTLDPPTTPATFTFAFTARDHAHNPCTTTENFDVVFDACELVITSPTAPVTADADGLPANGSQLDVSLLVSPACEGQTVTSTCGLDSPSGIVPAGGALTLRTDFCDTSPCELSSLCIFEVSTPDGVTTTTSSTLQFDDLGPPTTLAIVDPPLACGAQITPASDVDPATDGVQIVARVTSTGATTQTLELTNAAGTSTTDATTDVGVTLAPGANALVGIGADALGNDTRTAACTITLADLTVSFAQPAADGHIARADGTVAGNTITLPICGTVNKLDAAVSLAIDGAPPIAATVIGTDWCATVTLAESPPSHTLVASATAGASFGDATLIVAVDITLPPPVDNFLAAAIHRHLIKLVWESPSDNGQPVDSYIAKVSTTSLTDANFDTTGTILPSTPPLAPGSNEELDFDTARLGTTYFVAIATLDAAGNRSPAATFGPITTLLDRTGGIAAPDPSLGALRFGSAIASGRFNDDDFDDLAVAAPTQTVNGALNAGAVYIYFGSSIGISTTPDAIISSPTANGRFGSGLTAVRWSSATRDDLVVGAPNLDTHGRVALFHGGPSFAAGPRDATTADRTISVDPTTPGFFAASSFGTRLATADVDGDGTPDLVVAAPTGNANAGGAAIFYGDTITGSVVISDLDPTGINGAIVELFVDPGTTPNRRLGSYLHAVGPTAGPLDITDDLVLAYADDPAAANDALFVLRSDATRPTSPGVTLRPFVADRDARLDYITTSNATELAAQVSTLSDIDGDGARELVISAHAHTNSRGQVLVISGDFLGTAGVARTDDAGLVLTTINGGGGQRLGAIVLANDGISDFDNDGLDDLLVVGRAGGGDTGFLWYGGTLPAGVTTTTSASHSFPTPASFRIGFINRAGALGTAGWVGDLDGDGVSDVCWASPISTGDDGSFEVFD